MNCLFINGSPNQSGSTASLAQAVLAGHDYETLNLVDYKIYSYGQTYADDQFAEVFERIKAADLVVIGSPVYWHNMSGAVRNLLDRFYGPVEQGALHGKKLLFLFQGAAPESWMLESAEYTISRFAKLYGMEYLGMASSKRETEKLKRKIEEI